MVWEGDMPSLQLFIDRLNDNKNIVLTWTVAQDQVTFLEIYKHESKLHTRNHFKATDRNGYIPLTSCHHKLWLCNIPWGQFVRLRRNCTLESDYLLQSQTLATRFTSKGYSWPLIHQEIEKVRAIERNTIIADKVQDSDKEVGTNFKMLLEYNIQHRKFENTVTKHWPILKRRCHFWADPSGPSTIYLQKGPFPQRLFSTWGCSSTNHSPA